MPDFDPEVFRGIHEQNDKSKAEGKSERADELQNQVNPCAGIFGAGDSPPDVVARLPRDQLQQLPDTQTTKRHDPPARPDPLARLDPRGLRTHPFDEA